ncbi:MAG: ribonuclease PH [Planctomycetota bacterium]
MRTDGRLPEELRPVSIVRDYSRYAEGSVLIETGGTRVICTAMVEDRVPPHCMAENKGWVTAEYCMLPSANPQRRSLQAHTASRALEIQRLIGRSLRAAVDLHRLAGRSIWIDCNVVQADGGTRTASVTGGFVALVDALWAMKEQERLDCIPLLHGIAATSVGVVEGRVLVDLCADEDRAASVDMNVVMTHDGRFVELQGTAEGPPFDRAEHDEMLNLAQAGLRELKEAQARALGDRLVL